MKKGKIAIVAFSALAVGFFTGCATSPVAEYVTTETDIEPVAEYGTPVEIVREAPIGETVIERSSTISPQRCF